MCLASFAVSFEIALRLFASITVAPDLLVYGFRPSRATFQTAVGSYRKFRPHQIRYDRDVDGHRFVIRMNDRGFRGRTLAGAKSPGVIRVVTLGASSTFGHRNRDEDTYPSRLEELLGSSGSAFEVVNLGMPQLDSREIHALFVAEALPLLPDVVTFYEGANDARQHDDALSLANGRLSLSDRVLLAGVLNQQVLDHFGVLAYRPAELSAEADAVATGFLGELSSIAAECRRRGIVFIVANQQMKSLAVEAAQLRGVSYAEEGRIVRTKIEELRRLTFAAKHFLVHAVIMSKLREWARAESVPFVDVIGALDARRDYLISWVHLHPEANRIIARELARAVLAVASGKGTSLPTGKQFSAAPARSAISS